MVLRIPSAVVASPKEAVKPFLTETEAKSAFRIELYALQHWDKIDKSAINGLTPELINKIELFMSKFNFMGLDLAHTPNIKNFHAYWAIPIITGIIALAMSVYSLIRQRKTNPEMAKNPQMGCMMLFTPIMQIYFAFLFPTSVGIYIIMSSAISFLQMIVLNHLYEPKKVLARTMVDETIYRRSKENNTKKIKEAEDK